MTQRRLELANPACEIGPGQACRHPLVDEALNLALHQYEDIIRDRFLAIESMLRKVSSMQHEDDFMERAQTLCQNALGYTLPQAMLSNAWVHGLDMPDLYAHCVFQSLLLCVRQTAQDRSAWLLRLPISVAALRAMGYHTVNISPCADGRLQGLLPFILRIAPAPEITVKAFAGARFDIEDDISDWTQSELGRFSLEGGYDPSENYLKCVVYHFSSSAPREEGCAAHGSDDLQAVRCAVDGLVEFQSAIRNMYGSGAEPEGLVLGVDTDTDSIRVHFPDSGGVIQANQFLDSAQLYAETLSLSSTRAEQVLIERTRAHAGEASSGLVMLAAELIRANFSQIQYVVRYHQGRYADVGHDEKFICAGEAVSSLHLRNQYYFAHLSTVEEGSADLDVGIKIFTALNVSRGLAIPILVHFLFDARVSGSRQRAEDRCRRVVRAIQSRYADLHERQMIRFFMAVSDLRGAESVSPVTAPQSMAVH